MKPTHNRFDNIYEIRQSWKTIDSELEEAIKQPISGRSTKRLGVALIHYRVENFVRTVVTARRIDFPIFKVIIPRLAEASSKGSGTIYYVVKADGINRVFRVTYGYAGTRPHESALVEYALKKIEFQIIGSKLEAETTSWTSSWSDYD